MEKPTFVIGKSYVVTEECSAHGSSYEDRSVEATYQGLATDGCFIFVQRSAELDRSTAAHGIHIFFSQDYLWIDDMCVSPATVMEK